MIDITKSLEKMLNESPVRLSDIQNLQIAENEKALNELHCLCDRKLAYRFGVDEYVGRQFLWNLILDAIKAGNSLTNLRLYHSGHAVSQHLISEMLGFMVSDGLIKKEGDSYCIVLDKVLSRDIVWGFCQQRADQITIEDMLAHFHFRATVMVHGNKCPSAAFIHCKQIIDNLCDDDILKKSNIDNSFSWSDI